MVACLLCMRKLLRRQEAGPPLPRMPNVRNHAQTPADRGLGSLWFEPGVAGPAGTLNRTLRKRFRKMGGYGSGQSARRNQGVVESVPFMDVLSLRRRNGRHLLGEGLRIRCKDLDGGHAEQFVPITWTPCHFGGSRPWFICPACGWPRVRLYRESRGRYFCRECLRLVYRSQREDRSGRQLLRAFRVAERIDPEDTYGAGFGRVPPKPKGMHWRTYYRLADELQRAAAGSLSASRLIGKLGLIPPV
jgi:hypothetical protein